MSRHHRTVVRRVHPRREQIRLLVLSTLIMAMLAGMYFYGHYRGRTHSVPINTVADQLRVEVLDLQTQIDVDRQALDALRGELAESRGATDELERELAFYREVMAPEEVTKGVVLREPLFRSGAIPGQWRYQIVTQQGGRDRAVHKGEVFVTFWGHIAELPASYSLTELDPELSADALGLNFRYFQRFEGLIQLPPGFEPERVEVHISVSKPSKDSQEASYDWSAVSMSDLWDGVHDWEGTGEGSVERPANTNTPAASDDIEATE